MKNQKDPQFFPNSGATVSPGLVVDTITLPQQLVESFPFDATYKRKGSSLFVVAKDEVIEVLDFYSESFDPSPMAVSDLDPLLVTDLITEIDSQLQSYSNAINKKTENNDDSGAFWWSPFALLGAVGLGAVVSNSSSDNTSQNTNTVLDRIRIVDPNSIQMVLDADAGDPNAFNNLESITLVADEDVRLSVSNDGESGFMSNVRSISVTTTGLSGEYTVEFNISASANAVQDGLVGSNFMDQLESISVVAELQGNASMSISHSGGEHFLPALQSIYMRGTGEDGSADLSISASTNNYILSLGPDEEEYTDDDEEITLVNHYFMESLQSIDVASELSSASVSISSSGGNYFMNALREIEVRGGSSVILSISASANNYQDETLRGDFFMQSLESIVVVANGTGRASLSISTSGGIDFMSSLQTIYVESARTAEFSLSASVNNFIGATGNNMMESLREITIIGTGAEAGDNFYYASASIENDGGDYFMSSLESVRVEGLLNTRVAINIDNIFNIYISNGPIYQGGDDFMISLTSLEALASDTAYAEVSITNDVEGENFMPLLTDVVLGGLNAFVEMRGLMEQTSAPINIDITSVKGDRSSPLDQYSLSYMQTHELSPSSSAELVIHIGTSRLQYNAIYEVNEEKDINPSDTNDDFNGQQARLFTASYVEQVDINNYPVILESPGDSSAYNRVTSNFPNESLLSPGTIESGDFYGFAGIWTNRGYDGNSAANYNGVDPDNYGWVSLGGNDVSDTFKFTDIDINTIVIGGFEQDHDRFDFSNLSLFNEASIRDESDGSAHVSTRLGDILITFVAGSDYDDEFDDVVTNLFDNSSPGDVKIWLNTAGGNTSGFGDFESYIYVIGGAGVDWNSQHFILG